MAVGRQTEVVLAATRRRLRIQPDAIPDSGRGGRGRLARIGRFQGHQAMLALLRAAAGDGQIAGRRRQPHLGPVGDTHRIGRSVIAVDQQRKHGPHAIVNRQPVIGQAPEVSPYDGRRAFVQRVRQVTGGHFRLGRVLYVLGHAQSREHRIPGVKRVTGQNPGHGIIALIGKREVAHHRAAAHAQQERFAIGLAGVRGFHTAIGQIIGDAAGFPVAAVELTVVGQKCHRLCLHYVRSKSVHTPL